MPFGRYRGLELRDIPTGYLNWLATIHLDPWLRDAVRAECACRAGQQYESGRERRPPPPPPAGPAIRISTADVAMARRLVDAGYRALAQRLHPDHGGDVVEMQSFNSLVGRLTWGAGGAAVTAIEAARRYGAAGAAGDYRFPDRIPWR
jgi:hypothetical protein